MLQHTTEQASSLGISFNTPFKGGSSYHPEGIICSSQPDSQFHELVDKLSSMTSVPSILIGISSTLSDLTKLQEVAAKQSLKFQGYLFQPEDAASVILNDEILSLELEFLDHLLTNEEAAQLL